MIVFIISVQFQKQYLVLCAYLQVMPYGWYTEVRGLRNIYLVIYLVWPHQDQWFLDSMRP